MAEPVTALPRPWRPMALLAKAMSIGLYVLASCLMSLGFIGWFYAMSSSSGPQQRPDRSESPLGDVAGIGVSPQGEVFVGSEAYARIQVYSPEGRFLRGLPIPTGGGVFNFVLAEDGLIHVAVCRGRSHHIYDQRGNLIGTHEDVAEYERWNEAGEANREGCIDKDGNIYRFGYNPFISQVIRISPDGRKTVVVSNPLRLWPITFPFPSVVFTHGTALILAIYFIRAYFKKRRSMQQVPPGLFRKWDDLPTWIRRKYTKKSGSG